MYEMRVSVLLYGFMTCCLINHRNTLNFSALTIVSLFTLLYDKNPDQNIKKFSNCILILSFHLYLGLYIYIYIQQKFILC